MQMLKLKIFSNLIKLLKLPIKRTKFLTEKEFDLLLISINESSKENRNFLFLYLIFLLVIIFATYNITSINYLKNDDVSILFYDTSISIDFFLKTMPFTVLFFHIFIIQNLIEHHNKVKLYFENNKYYETAKKDFLFPFIFNSTSIYCKKKSGFDTKLVLVLSIIIHIPLFIAYQSINFIVYNPIFFDKTYYIFFISILLISNLVYVSRISKILSIFLFGMLSYSIYIFLFLYEPEIHIINSPLNVPINIYDKNETMIITINNIESKNRYLANIKFRNVSVENSFFEESTLKNITISNHSIFKNIYFENVKLDNLNINNSTLEKISFLRNINIMTNYNDLLEMNFFNLNVTDSIFKKVQFESVDINKSEFIRTDIIDSSFIDLEFNDVKFYGIKFINTNFKNVEFKEGYINSEFYNVNFTKIRFTNISLVNIMFENTKFKSTEFKNCKFEFSKSFLEKNKRLFFNFSKFLKNVNCINCSYKINGNSFSKIKFINQLKKYNKGKL